MVTKLAQHCTRYVQIMYNLYKLCTTYTNYVQLIQIMYNLYKLCTTYTNYACIQIMYTLCTNYILIICTNCVQILCKFLMLLHVVASNIHFILKALEF